MQHHPLCNTIRYATSSAMQLSRYVGFKEKSTWELKCRYAKHRKVQNEKGDIEETALYYPHEMYRFGW